MDDQRISALLLEAVRTLDTPTGKIVSGGIARGRRRLRLVRIGEGLTAVGVSAAVAGLVIALVPGDGGASHTATKPAASGSPPATPTTVAMTPQALLQISLDTLPRPGATSHYAGNFFDGFVATQFVYDDGHGPARVSVSLDYSPAGDGLGSACDISICTTRPDGSKFAVYQGNGHPGDPTAPGKDWQVSMLRTDHLTVSITEWNSTEEKSGARTRDLPPFTIAELTAWVDGPQWQRQISAADANAAAHLFKPVDQNTPTVQPDLQVRPACVEIGKQEKRRGISSRELAALRQQAERLHC